MLIWQKNTEMGALEDKMRNGMAEDFKTVDMRAIEQLLGEKHISNELLAKLKNYMPHEHVQELRKARKEFGLLPKEKASEAVKKLIEYPKTEQQHYGWWNALDYVAREAKLNENERALFGEIFFPIFMRTGASFCLPGDEYNYDQLKKFIR